jgi:iodotyrosine deiodinase
MPPIPRFILGSRELIHPDRHDMPARPPAFDPLSTYREYPPDEMRRRSRDFASEMQRRRTVRQFSDRPVPREVIDACLEAAGTAPSGANLQPWHFVVISDPAIKRQIREAAEEAERRFYADAPAEWLAALAPLGTDEHKPYLERAPYLIAVFAQRYGVKPDGSRVTHYYVMESVGIATGMLITALHHAGLVTLTHTPSPMGFLSQILERPASERPVMLLVTGYPDSDARVPRIGRKRLSDIASYR